MTKVKCVNCSEFHQVDSIDGKPEDNRAKVHYSCPENEVGYEAHKLVGNLKDVDVTRRGDELVA